MLTRQRITLIGIGAFLLSSGLVVGYFLPHTKTSMQALYNSGSDLHDTADNFKFTSPLLSCGDDVFAEGGTFSITTNIEQTVRTYIEQKKAAGILKDAAVYYRDLKNGPWAIVNSTLLSTPGSLLKVPLAMSIYKKDDQQPGFLNNSGQIEVADDTNKLEYFKPKQTLENGKTYTVRDLVKLTVEHSDNASALALSKLLTTEEIFNSYSDLGIVHPVTGSDYSMDVRTYASFFRVLYNASYVSREKSEELLLFLAHSEFNNGLRVGVPKDIAIAHKFGERTTADVAQLHDCGIVYAKNSPYILCVMTQGKDIASLASVIADISRMVYQIVK